MLGIPFRLLTQTDDGPVDKVILLRSRRSGEAGKRMQQAIRDYHRAEFEMVKTTGRWQALDARLAALPPTSEKLPELQVERDGLVDRVSELDEASLAAALTVVRLALAENYGAKGALDLLDQLNNRQVRAMVSLVETGQLPADFSDGPAAQPSATTTAQSGGSPGRSSSKRGTRRSKSKKG